MPKQHQLNKRAVRGAQLSLANFSKTLSNKQTFESRGELPQRETLVTLVQVF